MGEEKKKGGSFLKKLILTIILVPALSWVGYYAYAKTTHTEPTCLFTVVWNKCCAK
jgi:hypothetical protein